MAKKLTAKELREQAKKLMDKAKELEKQNQLSIGKKAVELYRENRIDGDLKSFIREIIGE